MKCLTAVWLLTVVSCQSILNGGTEDEIFQEVSTEIMASDPLLFHVYATKNGNDLKAAKPIYAAKLTVKQSLERASDLLAKAKKCRAKQRDFNLDLESAIFYLEHTLERDSFVLHHYPFASDHGIHLDVMTHFSNKKVSSKKEVESYLEELRVIDQRFKELIDELEIRRKNGFVAPSNILKSVKLTCDSIVLIPIDENPIYSTYFQNLNSIGLLEPTKKDAYIESCKEVLLESVIPAYVRLSNYLAQLEETSLNVVGVWRFPQGDEFYQHCLRWHAGLDLSVDSIYSVAKSELREAKKHQASSSSTGQMQTNIEFPKETHNFRIMLPTNAHKLGYGLHLHPEGGRNRIATAKLIVDIGIHQKRWLREQAVQFLTSKTNVELAQAERIVNQSISNPGLIGSEKIGQLVIKKLREEHSNLSDSEFDKAIRQHGALPLSVLIESFSKDIQQTTEN